MDFYLILRELMDEKNLTIPEVSRLCDLPDGTIRSILTRKSKNVSLEVAFKISAGLKVSLERLNGEKDHALQIPSLSSEAMQVAREYEMLSFQGRERIREEIRKQIDVQNWVNEIFVRVPTQTLNQNMREFREYKGLSQKDLAVKTGIPIETIRNYESDQSISVDLISEQNLFQIATVLGVAPKLLLGISETNEAVAERTNQNLTMQMEDALEKLNPDGLERAAKIVKGIAKKSKYEESLEAFSKYNDGCITVEELFSHLAFLDRQKAVEAVDKLIKQDGGRFRRPFNTGDSQA